MKLRFLFFYIVLIFGLFLYSNVFAAPGINKQLPYQAVLKTSAGVNVADGDLDMLFKIYSVSTGGSPLWTGTHTAANGNAVTVTDGVFSVLLGSGTGNAMTVDFTDDTLYLGVTIGADPEMTPRKRIGASGYAFNTDTLDGVDSLSFLRSDAADIMSASSSSAILTITQSGTGDILNIFDGATEAFTILDGGNVGIGTTSPADLLHIAGGQLRIDNDTNDTNKGCFRYNGTSNELEFSNDCSAFQSFSASSGGGWTDDGTVVRLTTVTDNVGIGMTDPLANLAIGTTKDSADDSTLGNWPLLIQNFANDTGEELGIGFRTSNVQGSSNVPGGGITFERTGANSVGSLHFKTSPSLNVLTTRMTIDSAGNVGIGETAPTQMLHIEGSDPEIYLHGTSGNAFESGRIRLAEFTTGGGDNFKGGFIHFDGSANVFNIGVHDPGDQITGNDVNAISIDRTTADVGIGTATPSSTLHVLGDFTVTATTTFNGVSYNWPGADGTSNQLLSTNGSGVLSWATSGGGGGLFTDGGTFTYLTSITDDLALGSSTADGPFLFDISASLLTINHNSGDPTIDFQTASTTRWTIGVDDSDNDKFRIAQGGVFNATSSGITINAAGNVGIGTTSPETKLHLADAGPLQIILEADTDNTTETDTPSILFRRDGGTDSFRVGVEGTAGTAFTGSLANTPYLQTISASHGLQFATNGNARITIEQSGDVGIGTETPSAALDVIGVIEVSNEIQILDLGSATDPGITWENDGNTGIFTGGADILGFTTGGSEAMRIDASGNVGIGSLTPDNGKLVVASGSSENITLIAFDEGSGGGSANNFKFRGDFTGTGTSNLLILEDFNGNIDMAWSAGGKVGIGNSSLKSVFEVVSSKNVLADLAVEENYHLKLRNPNNTNGEGVGISFGMSSTNSQQTAAIVAKRTGGNGQGTLQFYTKQSTSAGVAPVFAMIIDQSGNVGIGETVPADLLDVDGDIRVGSDNNGCVKDGNGTVIAGTCSSDAALKKNVVSLSGVLEKLIQIKPVTFNWRVEEFPEYHFGTATSTGLIAQNVEEYFPQYVSVDKYGHKTVNFSALPMLLLRGIQEQQEQIQELFTLSGVEGQALQLGGGSLQGDSNGVFDVGYDELEARVTSLEIKLNEQGTISNDQTSMTNVQSNPNDLITNDSASFLTMLKSTFNTLGATINDGILKVKGLITSRLVIERPDPLTNPAAASGQATIGEGVILQNTTSTIIEAPVLGVYDKVFVTPRSHAKHPLFIPDLFFDESFTVEIAEPATEDIYFDWWIVGVKLVEVQAEPLPDFTIPVDTTADALPDFSTTTPQTPQLQDVVVQVDSEVNATSSDTAANEAPIVTVLNGSGIVGLATKVASVLENEGFIINTIGDAERFDYKKTIIQYEVGKEKEAQFVREGLGGKAVLEEVESGMGITVIIGNNEEELTLWVHALVRSIDVATSATTTATTAGQISEEPVE